MIFGNNFNQPITNFISNCVTHGNKPIINAIPNNVIYLKFGNCFDQPITSVVSSRVIDGNYFDQHILYALPVSIKEIIMPKKYIHIIRMLPISIKLSIL